PVQAGSGRDRRAVVEVLARGRGGFTGRGRWPARPVRPARLGCGDRLPPRRSAGDLAPAAGRGWRVRRRRAAPARARPLRRPDRLRLLPGAGRVRDAAHHRCRIRGVALAPRRVDRAGGAASRTPPRCRRRYRRRHPADAVAAAPRRHVGRALGHVVLAQFQATELLCAGPSAGGQSGTAAGACRTSRALLRPRARRGLAEPGHPVPRPLPRPGRFRRGAATPTGQPRAHRGRGPGVAQRAPLRQRLAAGRGRHVDARARSARRRRPALPAAAAGRRRPDAAARRPARTVAAPAPPRASLRLVDSHRRPLAWGDDHARPGAASAVGTGHAAARTRRRHRCTGRRSDRTGHTGTPAALVPALGSAMTRFEHAKRTAACIGVPLCLVLVTAWLALLPTASGRAQDAASPAPITLDQAIGLVNQYCGACHRVPPPDLMPKRDWPAAVQTMAELSERMRGHEFIPADVLPHIKAFYYGSAPAELPRLPYLAPAPSPVRFRASTLGATAAAPLVTHVSTGLSGAPTDLLVS